MLRRLMLLILGLPFGLFMVAPTSAATALTISTTCIDAAINPAIDVDITGLSLPTGGTVDVRVLPPGPTTDWGGVWDVVVPTLVAPGHYHGTLPAGRFIPSDNTILPVVAIVFQPSASGIIAADTTLQVGGCTTQPANPNPPAVGPASPGATPELDSLILFGSGVSGIAGYGLMRLRVSRRVPHQPTE